MNEKLIGLDLGSKSLKICLTEVDQKGEINLLTSLEKEISSLKNGEIIEEELFNSEVVGFLYDFLEQFKWKNFKLILSFSSSTFSFQKIRTKTLVENKYVSEEDIRKCKSLARASLISSSSEIIYEETGRFYIDNYTTPIRNPLGLEARQLEVELNMVQIFKPYLLRIQNIFQQARLPIASIYPNPLGASSIILDQKLKEDGCILIDGGYKTTSLVSFYGGNINNFIVFSFGLEDILASLFNEFDLDIESFRKISEEFRSPNQGKRPTIKKKRIPNFSHLTKALEKKLNYLFKEKNVFDFLEKEKKINPTLGGVFLIGGLSYLPEIENLIRKIIKINVKKAKDLGIRLKNEEDSKFLNALGNVNLYLKRIESTSFISEILNYFKNFFSNILPF